MDIREIRDRALDFKRTLDAKKAALAPQTFSWYHYDILANFSHLDALLTGQYRFLLDLIGGGPLVDFGCADGDLAFFLETLGCRAQVIDYTETNYNGLQGVKMLKGALSSSVEIHEIDLDAQFTVPRETYRLVFLLGILYHLKNPYYILETLAKSASYCLVSTRIAKFNKRAAKLDTRFAKLFFDERTQLSELPVAYLLDEGEANHDSTNYWIFSEAGLRRILKRTGWEVCNYMTVGNTSDSDPASPEGDERAFCLIKSRSC